MVKKIYSEDFEKILASMKEAEEKEKSVDNDENLESLFSSVYEYAMEIVEKSAINDGWGSYFSSFKKYLDTSERKMDFIHDAICLMYEKDLEMVDYHYFLKRIYEICPFAQVTGNSGDDRQLSNTIYLGLFY